jgi:hypothetical protein
VEVSFETFQGWPKALPIQKKCKSKQGSKYTVAILQMPLRN